MSLEYRATTELRATGRKLVGIAAPYMKPAQIGRFRETIMPGAFKATLATRADILGLLDHDPHKLLARTLNGSLRLSETSEGLAYELDLPNTTLGNDLRSMSEAGLLGGMSIAFRAVNEAWRSMAERELMEVDLVEVSVIQSHAAYETSVSLRCRPINGSTMAARSRILDML